MTEKWSIGKWQIGLAATAFACILGLLQVPELDIFLRVTLACFSLSLPVSTICGIVISYYPHSEKPSDNFIKWHEKVFYASLGTTFYGMAFLISHFSWVSGIVFCAISLMVVLSVKLK